MKKQHDKEVEKETLAEGVRVIRIEAETLTELAARMDHRFVEAVALCSSCRGRIVVIGMGKSGLIGKKIAATLSSTGSPAFFLHPAEGIHGDLGMVSKEDIAIAISNSGETEEILRILPSIKRLNLKLITLTGSMKSTLAKMADVVLDVSVREEACPLGLAPTASTTATLAMGDALAIALLQKKGFRKEDFASFHPGGTLGRNLLLKVKDAMHTGDAVPKVAEETPMKEVVLEMTGKKLGMTTVLNQEGKLSGVITDGDLRRLIRKVDDEKRDIFSLPAKEVMNRTPRTIEKEALAAQAVHMMETYSITALIVRGESGFVEGILHLHDLLKKGAV
ncbi:MAG TPA: KpsF/GutQ family sugar-phosphate isomerase [Candidatus Manganitrophaceae bacterium]|nr:KpsF/GutQ family sugar-phosphate isomerase [Candidatus Manganitrophaceae bacterium]